MGISKKRATPRQQVGEAPARYGAAARPAHSLADALFTTTQQRVLGALYGQPQSSFTVSELIARTGAGSGAAQRELTKLTASGLLTLHPVGNQKRYQANPAAPIHAELVGIMQKTVALATPLCEALTPIANKIDAAFVFGSVAKQSDTAASDIDLMIVSDALNYGEVMRVLDPAYAQLGRPINPMIYSHDELARRTRADNAFVKRVLQQPKIWLIGGEDDLRP